MTVGFQEVTPLSPAGPDKGSQGSAARFTFTVIGKLVVEGPSEHLQVIVEERRGSNGDGLESDAMRAVEGAEAIIYNSSWIPFYGIAEKLDVPCASAMLMPLTRRVPSPAFSSVEARIAAG